MLRNAKEVVKASLIAKMQAEADALKEREKQEGQKRRDAECAANHAEFERRAEAAATQGDCHLIVPDLSLSEDVLVKQGFVVRKVTKRASYEAHLLTLQQEKRARWTGLCEQLVSECRGLEKVRGDAFAHRNPLASWMESQWPQLADQELIELHSFLRSVIEQTEASDGWVSENSERLCELLRAFEEFKHSDAKYRAVSSENSLVPPGVRSAIRLSWAESDDESGLNVEFSAAKLKWLAGNWSRIATWLAADIDTASSLGKFQVDFLVSLDFNSWFLAPSRSGTDDTFTPACNPVILLAELRKNGYGASLKRIRYDDDGNELSVSKVSEHEVASSRSEAQYELMISWGM